MSLNHANTLSQTEEELDIISSQVGLEGQSVLIKPKKMIERTDGWEKKIQIIVCRRDQTSLRCL